MSQHAQVVDASELRYSTAMTYRVIKTISNRRYVYEQRTWREGKRVRTESRYIEPADSQVRRRRLSQKIADFIKANVTPDREVITEEMLQQYNARVEAQEQARLAKLDDLYVKYGLRVSDDKPELRATPAPSAAAPAAERNAAQPSDPSAEESPSGDEGQGSGADAADGAQNS
jgi:hypothetical protein